MHACDGRNFEEGRKSCGRKRIQFPTPFAPVSLCCFGLSSLDRTRRSVSLVLRVDSFRPLFQTDLARSLCSFSSGPLRFLCMRAAKRFPIVDAGRSHSHVFSVFSNSPLSALLRCGSGSLCYLPRLMYAVTWGTLASKFCVYLFRRPLLCFEALAKLICVDECI